MSRSEKIEWPAGWPAWTLKIARDLERAEGSFGSDFLAGAPQWVEGMLGECMLPMFTKVRADDLTKDGPQIVGALLGHHKRLVTGDEGMSRAVDRAMIALKLIEKRIRAKLTQRQLAHFQRRGQRLIDTFQRIVERKERVLAASLELANRQPIEQQAGFFTAYAAAVDDPIYDGDGNLAHERFPGLSKLYFVMVVNWRQIQALRTVPALHEWLRARIPPAQLGDVDRVKGICRRFRIKLASRGRPRKIKG